MSGVATINGPVSAALEADLRTWVRRQGIVVWLDLDDHYTAFVDRLLAARAAGALPYALHAFRGSYLALMLALEGIAGGADKIPLVIHLPGFNEERVAQTPLYELYAAGVRYRKALDTLITEAAAGRVRPDQIDAFKQQPDLTLAQADAWLAALLRDGAGELATQLQAVSPTALFDDLLGNGYLATRLTQQPDDPMFWQQIAAWTGLPVTWRETIQLRAAPRAEEVAFAVASWALCVEYAYDLKRPTVSPLLVAARALPKGVIELCRTVAGHLRMRHPAFYRRTADETEALLPEESEAVQAADLGKIDTFRFEEDEVLKAALAALQQGAWESANEWAALRVGATTTDTAFWLRNDPTRQSAWQLVAAAANLGQALVRAGEQLIAKGGLTAAVDFYTQRGAAVDQAHRQLEQRRVELLYPQLPEFESLRARLDEMRQRWRHWADGWARDFNALCRAQGFLPDTAYQQRYLFDEVVRPLTREPGTTAYFVVDALRYEMGEELYRQLVDTPASTVQLKARLAELPTVTAVGMNVLAPVVVNGRLSPVMSNESSGSKITGFLAGEFRVATPETRKRAMHDRVGGAASPWLTLDEVVTRDSAWLKRSIAQAKLVVIHSQEIDNAGEKEVGPAIFNQVMQKLRAAWHLLRDAGVRRFVFAADHGFLLLNESTGAAQPHGRKIDPMRRHVFSPVAADHAGEVRVALADLGYEGAAGYLMFPDSTAVFATRQPPMSYVHGGNSLQERVIPVLTVVHRAAAGGNLLQYQLTAAAREGVAGMHCLALKVDIVAQQVLDFGTPREIELALRVPDMPGVQVELIQTRGKASIKGGVIRATVGEEVELFFRLAGRADARVLVELHHPSAVADVQPCVLDARFTVTAMRAAAEAVVEPTATSPAIESSWLEQLPEGGVRQLFAHLAAHGTVTEGEAATMLGSQRAVRQFSIRFEEYAQKAPFAVRIDTVGGVKRYVREG
jgi:hypothetical protein